MKLVTELNGLKTILKSYDESGTKKLERMSD